MKLALLPALALLLAGCANTPCGEPPVCGNSEPAVVQVYDDPAPAACAQSACGPCANGQCAVPQARVVAPAVVGEYGYVLGRPGVRENVNSLLVVPPKTLKCLADGAHKIVVTAIETGQCVLTSLYPVAEPSQNLVRVERIQRPAVRTRARVTDPCGRPVPGPVPPAPPPDGVPPESIPATRPGGK